MTDYRDTPRSTRARLPPALEEALQRQLEPREQVVWAGRPTMRWVLRQAAVGAFFALLWCGFIALFAYLGRHVGALLVFASMFALLGLLGVRVIVAQLLAAYRCSYALTDRRAIVSRALGSPGLEQRSLSLEAIVALRLRDRSTPRGLPIEITDPGD